MGNYCGDCGEVMSGRSKCSCGWQDQDKQISNHMCAFRDGARTCPKSGACSKSTSGGGNWYCLNHFSVIGDHEKGIEILDLYDSEPIEAQTNWREKALDDYNRRVMEMVTGEQENNADDDNHDCADMEIITHEESAA